MTYQFLPQGVCARRMLLTVEDGVLRHLEVEGGCHGNLQALCALTEGMPVQTVIDKLGHIRCGGKPTSCPHQLTVALEAVLEKEGQGSN